VLTAIVNSPFLPPEWLTAHGFAPCAPAAMPMAVAGEGRCGLAQAMQDAVARSAADVAIWATSCDQMRRSGDELPTDRPTFRFHVPVAWQGAAAFQFYTDELHRLGRFLVAHGGKAPSPEILSAELAAWELRRRHLRELRNSLPPKDFTRRLLAWPDSTAQPPLECPPQLEERRKKRGAMPDLTAQPSLECGAPAPLSLASEAHSVQSQSDTGVSHSKDRFPLRPEGFAGQAAIKSPDPAPLALLGSALMGNDLPLFDAIGRAGGTVVLNGTDNGETILPDPIDPDLSAEDPFTAMAEAHFRLPALFRRPNSGLHAWLKAALVERGVRGLVVRRQPWCDLWHAELPRLREECDLPLLDLEVADDPTNAHLRNRIEAFLESLA
jgi:hypothetical protein